MKRLLMSERYLTRPPRSEPKPPDSALKALLREAFDEGAESPYDLREEAVNRISEKGGAIHLQRPVLEDQTWLGGPFARQLAESLPVPVKKLLKVDQTYLCGGSILRTMLNQEKMWDGDWDIFCTEAAFSAAQFDEVRTQEVNLADEYQTKNYRGKTFGLTHPINVIVSDTFTSPEAILKTFDLTIVQWALKAADNKVMLKTYRQSIIDTVLGQIHLVRSSLATQPKTKQRIAKYVERGFRDCTGICEQHNHLSQLMTEFRNQFSR